MSYDIDDKWGVRFNSDSPRGKLNGTDLSKLAKSFGLGLAGFLLVWVGDVLIPGLEFSSIWAPFIGAMAPVMINLGRKLVVGGPA